MEKMLQKGGDFLKIHWDEKSPLLLGYSGGPDSKALLYLLLEAGYQSHLHLAHVDHGWREESHEEALVLAEEAKRLSIPFHVTRIDAKGEAASREKRFVFFQSLFEKIPFQALLLAHHRGDVIETTLKRIFEGAHFAFQMGIKSISKLYGMPIWRPFLSVEKEEIFSFLEKRNISFFTDPTNHHPSYLRGRMRTEILPFLTKSFGKEIADNLYLHKERSEELKAYLDRKVSARPLHRGPFGAYGSLFGLERLEARHLLQTWASEEGISFSRKDLEKALDAVLTQKPNFRLSPRTLIDRGFVFFLNSSFPKGGDPLPLRPGKWTWGDWTLEIEEKPIHNTSLLTDWKAVWGGHFCALSSEGVLKMPIPGESPRHLWNEKKVPAFLRFQIPVVKTKEGEVKEFLSGKFSISSSTTLQLTFSTSLEPMS